jgi:hypothetical protein
MNLNSEIKFQNFITESVVADVNDRPSKNPKNICTFCTQEEMQKPYPRFPHLTPKEVDSHFHPVLYLLSYGVHQPERAYFLRSFPCSAFFHILLYHANNTLMLIRQIKERWIFGLEKPTIHRKEII